MDDMPGLDKSAISITDFEQAEAEDKAYWLSKTPQERLRALEINRRLVYGEDRATQPLQRLLEIAELDRG